MKHMTGSRSILDYHRIQEEADKPIGERSKIIKTNRGEFKVPRKYHLSQDKVDILLASSSVPNPYRRGGLYHALIDALIQLGVNRRHNFFDVKTKLKHIMYQWVDKKTGANGWDLFLNKKPKNSLCACDANGRIIQNAYILQRLTGFHPYGEKLRQLGMCIDIFRGANDLPDFQLKTGIESYESVAPINEFRKKS